MRTIRAAACLALVSAVAVGLSGCAILLSPFELLNGEEDATAPMLPDPEVGVGSCIDTIAGHIVHDDELVACSDDHSVDIIAMIEWPGMDELLSQETPRTVWDEVSQDYALKGIALEYERWAADACGDAWRTLIGWDRLNIAGHTAAEIDLLPAGIYEVIAGVAESGPFLEGDHRTRCALSWLEPVQYRDQTAADFLSPDFPVAARDCYTLDDEGYLQGVHCSFPHTDQSLVTFDGLVALGPEFVTPDAILDEEQSLAVNNFCSAAVQGTLGTVDGRDHYIWGGPWGSPDWAALTGEPDPEGTYSFGCVISRYDGEHERGDVFTTF